MEQNVERCSFIKERNNYSTTLLHGVEDLYSKILLRSGVERSSGVGVDPYTRHKTETEFSSFPVVCFFFFLNTTTNAYK